jgi:hypothetical protein
MGSEVLMPVSIKIMDTLKLEAVGSFKIFVPRYETTWLRISEDCNLQTYLTFPVVEEETVDVQKKSSECFNSRCSKLQSP